MSSWSLLICEGAHDQEFLLTLATHAVGWKVVDGLHPSVPASFAPAISGLTPPRCISRGDHGLIIVGVGGDTKVLGTPSHILVDIASTSYAVGVLIDADDVGVEQRRVDVMEHFTPKLPNARGAQVGQVVGSVADGPRFGLWVAPDCSSSGSLDDVIYGAVATRRPDLVGLSTDYVDNLGKTAGHEWGQFRYKAILGSYGQLWKAGNSLASALQNRDEWIDQAICETSPYAEMMQFLEALLP